MHRSKGKLSGVLHKGFKPDKWSVQIDFRPLPLPLPGWRRVVGDSNTRFASLVFIGDGDVRSKTSLRMAVARIKLLRNRKEAQVRQMRREVAQLLEANQDMTARIRVRASSHRFVISLHPRPLLRGDSTRLQRVIPRLTS